MVEERMPEYPASECDMFSSPTGYFHTTHYEAVSEAEQSIH